MMKIVANFNNILLGSWRPATGILRKDRIWYQKGPAGRMLPALGDHVPAAPPAVSVRYSW